MRCGSFVTAVLILQRILDVIIDTSLKVPVIRCIYFVRNNFLIYFIFKKINRIWGKCGLGVFVYSCAFTVLPMRLLLWAVLHDVH